MLNDDQKWPIPEKFRASADLTDEVAFVLLQKNDAEQAKLAEQIQSPFSRSSPRDAYRRKAKVTIETLLKFQPWSDEQREQYCEAQAALGRYDIAAETSRVNSEHYTKIWDAVFLPDADWCEHGDARMFVSAYIWSIKEGKELALLKCGICGMMNVLDKPERLVTASKARAAHQGKTRNMSMSQIKQYHKHNVTRNG